MSMVNLGTEAPAAENNAPAQPPASNNGSTSQAPPPMYTSAPPSYGSYQGPPNQGPPQGNAPPYGAPQGNRPPPAYMGGGGGRGGYGGPRRGGWGGPNQQGNNGPMQQQQQGNAPSDGNSDGNGSNNGDREPTGNQSKFKTRMCQNFLNGQCTWGNNCAFAHSDNERRFGSPNTSNSNAPSFAQVMGGGPDGGNYNNGDRPRYHDRNGHPNGGAPPPSYDRTGVPPPYAGNGSPHKGQRTPPPMIMGGFPTGGANYVTSPISPRSPIKLSSPTGTGQGQRFRYEPYGAMGKTFSSDNLQGMASGPQSPREQQKAEAPKE